jgi:hypothetical protein
MYSIFGAFRICLNCSGHKLKGEQVTMFQLNKRNTKKMRRQKGMRLKTWFFSPGTNLRMSQRKYYHITTFFINYPRVESCDVGPQLRDRGCVSWWCHCTPSEAMASVRCTGGVTSLQGNSEQTRRKTAAVLLCERPVSPEVARDWPEATGWEASIRIKHVLIPRRSHPLTSPLRHATMTWTH